MRVILFQSRFWLKILDGSKCSTIRLKARCSPGDTLSLRGWTDKPYRSPQRLLRTEICQEVSTIRINDGIIGEDGIRIGGNELTMLDAGILAHFEGFDSLQDMFAWFRATHSLPFHGEFIGWTPSEKGLLNA